MLFSHLESEPNELIRHELVILTILKRPKGWKKVVQKYIVDQQRDSFFLYDVQLNLRQQHSHGFASARELRDIAYLIRSVTAKHLRGMKIPRPKDVQAVSDKEVREASDYATSKENPPGSRQ